MQVYNDEYLRHFGIPGMHWGKRKIQDLKRANDEYKTKIGKIANSKSAHKADVAAAEAVNKGLHQRVSSNLTRAAVSTLIGDILSGEVKNYGSMSYKDMLKKAGTVASKAATNMALEEIRARSVADKYNIKGKRVKGSNSSLLTREQVIEGGVNTALMVAPLVKTLGYMKMADMYSKRKAGEAAFSRWGDRILTDKRSDPSNYIPDVKFTVN